MQWNNKVKDNSLKVVTYKYLDEKRKDILKKKGEKSAIEKKVHEHTKKMLHWKSR